MIIKSEVLVFLTVMIKEKEIETPVDVVIVVLNNSHSGYVNSENLTKKV